MKKMKKVVEIKKEFGWAFASLYAGVVVFNYLKLAAAMLLVGTLRLFDVNATFEIKEKE
jgi:hypothetical protein